MPTKVRLLHGIHAPEGSHNMARFAPHLAGAMPQAQVLLWQYGFMGWWQARWRNDWVAREFAAESKLGRQRGELEIWVTHSNGAAVAYLAVEKYGATPDMIININPALDRWRTATVPYVLTIHSPGDRWVWLSQWIPGHIWGDQGKVGYHGRMTNTLNLDAGKVEPAMRYDDHTGAFDPKRIRRWAYFCAARIEQMAEFHALRRTDRRVTDPEFSQERA